ncbi:MAG TPA: acyl-CoA dehydrogenase family protein, partial [Deinococcales bacterium]|nr:acyl-CoA dehydrogenase family protein [Deinococcales bacterium]
MSLLDFRHLRPEQAERVAAAHVVADVARRNAARADREGRIDREGLEAFRRSPLVALTLPRPLGGLGAGLADAVRVLQVLGRGDASLALIAAMQFHVIGSAGQSGSWPGVLERLAPGILEGALLNSAASEPELGSPSRGGRMRTVAAREGDGWRLDGRKTWVTGAPELDCFIVTAAIEGEDVPG